MRILIRCDADIDTGIGHMMRCLALAQDLKDSGYRVSFVSNSLTGWMKKKLVNEGFELFFVDKIKGSGEDAKETSKIALEHKAEWVITDGYHFQTNYQQIIKENGLRLMCIDDVAGCHYVSDIVLNQNPGFKLEDYSAAPETKFLLGLKYALLRREFRAAKPGAHPVSKNILITMGGTDPHNLTGQVLSVLLTKQLEKITVLLGSINPNIPKIKKMLKVMKSGVDVQLVIDADNIIPYMSNCGLAIHAAGTTSWELAYLGIPSLCYILAANQEPVAKALVRSGYSRNLGWYNDFSKVGLTKMIDKYLSSPELLEEMSQAGRSLIDGKGVGRIIEVIKQKPKSLKIQRASLDDAKDLFEWRNHPDVRKNFFNPAAVSWEEHKNWLKSRLEDQNATIYTVWLADEKIGSVRFELKEGMFKVSVMLNPAFFGQGLGARAIARGVISFVSEQKSQLPIWAEIKPDNVASIKAFAKAGFVQQPNRAKDFVAMKYAGGKQ